MNNFGKNVYTSIKHRIIICLWEDRYKHPNDWSIVILFQKSKKANGYAHKHRFQQYLQRLFPLCGILIRNWKYFSQCPNILFIFVPSTRGFSSIFFEILQNSNLSSCFTLIKQQTGSKHLLELSTYSISFWFWSSIAFCLHYLFFFV